MVRSGQGSLGACRKNPYAEHFVDRLAGHAGLTRDARDRHPRLVSIHYALAQLRRREMALLLCVLAALGCEAKLEYQTILEVHWM